tara:strand:- start:10300 stop:14886 length:4587 start_codon:yes stop_codon:yes gene_type:complete
MTVAYRNNFTAYKQDHEANYASIGSIFPVPVDSFSTDPAHALGGAGSGGETMEYSYKGYLYCDGRELNIRDYPQLYSSIRNTYGGSTTSKPTQSSNAGGMRRITWISNKCFINFYRDPDIAGGNKLPYPYGTAFRMADDTSDTPAGPGLGSMPAADWEYGVFYTTQLPSETLSVPNGEFAYEVVFPDTIDPATLPKNNVDITTGTHPSITLNKSFTYADSPHQVGTFKLPDYRDRIIVGVGDVDGEGTPTVENALVNSVGQTGGKWYISKDEILDGGVFFSIGDVRTTGYQNIQADVFTFLTGSVDFRVGPIEDYIFNRPVEHNHYILSSIADDAVDNERDGVPIDEFAVNYVTSRANILPFEPVGQGGLALGHSHGLTREKLNDPTLATFGNTPGPGGEDPNQPADIFYDVNSAAWASLLHPLGDGRIGYDDISLEDHGPGTGEWEGFLKPGIAQGNKYLAFGYGATATGFSNPGELKRSRRVELELDFTGYTQLYVFAVAGNDNNGGERPNNIGEGLYCQFSNGETLRLFPSVQDYRDENGLGTTEAFDLYDAIHSNWREFIIDIPAALQDQPNQVVTLKQDLASGSEQGSGVPAGNLNANDMLGIQGVGLRGGIIQDPPDPNGCYPITGSPIISVLSAVYDSGNNYVLVTTAEPHGFSKGDYITVQGAIPDTAGMYNGTFQILDNQYSTDSFTYTPESTPSLGIAAGTISVRIAAGTFEDVTTTPAPRLYAIDGQTVIGGKADIFTPPGTGTIFQTDELLSQGSFTLPAVAASEGIVTRIDLQLRAPGGGGGGTSGDGSSGGYAYVTLDVGGNTYTCYAYGGGGGQAGDNGGNGGSGGTYLVPAALLALDIIDIAGSLNGNAGSNGGNFGAGTISGGAGAGGAGGVGSSGTFVTSTDTGFVTQGGTSWTAPSSTGVSSRTVTIRVAGGGGGGGNGNANSGCQAGSTQAPFGDGSANGGSGGAGALITANCGFGPNSFTWTLGQGGQPGFNNQDGYVNGNGTESGTSSGGSGASPGGDSGLGYWGNGATGGGGGGSTGIFLNGVIPLLGAGGGGGGGGSGGGYNGSGTTDGCYAGGNNQGATSNNNGQTTALDFTFGSNGTTGNCTAGGGGGGGGGCGIGGQANGGVGGQAGQGHNGNGGGTGGARGRSAYRSDLCTASWSTAGNGGAPGNAGGAGYVQIRVQDETENDGRLGGGGGSGSRLLLSIANTNTSITCGLQSAGSNGGDGSGNGGVGYVKAEYRGTIPGDDVEGTLSNPAGGYYECDETGVPGSLRIDSNIWKESSANGDTKEVLLKPVTPGNGTGSAGKFQMSTSANGEPPRYGSRANRYLPFAGDGTREYVIGPLDLSNAEKIQWSVIRGTGLNGGDAPEEDLLLYYRVSGSSTVNLLGVVKSSTGGDSNWSEVDVNIPSNSNARNTSVELLLRQTRVITQDDNADLTLDNYGVSAMTIFYGEETTRVFTPTDGTEICDIDFVDRTVNVVESGMATEEGLFTMSSSTPITVTAEAIPENNIPLITKYHRVKYLIKAV